MVWGGGFFRRVETFVAPPDISDREIRKYTKLLGITRGNISWEWGIGTTTDIANSFGQEVMGVSAG